MYITAREKWILDHLLDLNEETTTLALSKELEVSQRTIHRDLKGVEGLLEPYGLTLKKTTGRGIQIIGATANRQDLKKYLMEMEHTEYTPEQRQHLILCELLENQEPVKLVALANELNVTIATVSNDLDKLEEPLRKLDLNLIRKRGYGVEIEGSEKNKRRAMSGLIMEQLSESEFLSVVRDNIQRKSNQLSDTISERLLGIVEKRKIKLVEEAIEEVYHDLPFAIADSAFIGLVVHLALAIERISRNETIVMDDIYLNDLKKTKEFQYSALIAEKLEAVFEITIPEAEIGYICMHLHGAKLRQDKEHVLDESNYRLAYKVRQLIDYIGKVFQQDLSKDHSLLQGLVAHLKPALYRIQEKMGITNPLLPKIKEDYLELFNVVSLAMKEIFPELEVPEEEVGYIAMHFGAALVKTEHERETKVLIICSSGIGTSKMLASRLARDLPEVSQFQNASLFDLKKLNRTDYDLVLSTIPLPDLKDQYELVSPIPTKNEINKIREALQKHPSKPVETERASINHHESSERLISGFKKRRNYSEVILQLLEGFSVTFIKKIDDLEKVLTQASELLYEKGVLEDSNQIVQALLKREQIGGVGIPNTSLGLYHTRQLSVQVPSFTIYELEQPIKIMGMDNTPVQLAHLLLMLSPENLYEEGLEILSYISALIIENEESLSIFQSGSEERILTHLSRALETYYEEHTRSGSR